MAAGEADDALHVDEVIDSATIDRSDEVAGLEARHGGRAARLDRGDPRHRDLLAEHHEDGGKKHDREDEIGERTGDHDGSAATDRLAEEALLALLFAHGGERVGVRHARLVLVAEELDVAAERNRGDLPPRAPADR